MTLASLFDGKYLISDAGALYSIRSAKWLKPAHDKYGYIYFVVSIDGKRATLKAHRLVALAFIPNVENKPTVNHKNGIRDDNRVENLEWATAKEQANDPLTKKHIKDKNAKTDFYAMGLIRNFGRKKVAVYKDVECIGIYNSLKEAATHNNVNYSKASECANGKRNKTGGLKFCYINN